MVVGRWVTLVGEQYGRREERRSTGVWSASIDVWWSQDVDEPWPLVVTDHAGRQHNVTMRPGEMVSGALLLRMGCCLYYSSLFSDAII